MPPAVTKRARRKAERPSEILDAAFEEFVMHGYAATRLEDVAARAGVTKGTIYFYFDTKERVFEEMVRHKSQSFLPGLKDYALTLPGSATERLRGLIAFTYGHIAENRESREILRFLIAEGGRFPDLVDRHYEEFVAPIIDQFREVIDQGVAAGEFRDAPAAGFTEIVMSPAVLLSLWSLLFGTRKEVDFAAFTEASVDLLLRGLAKN
ncbi:TetR/AcrR family transcriptional regulator [Rhodopseudomonas sp. WA056]|uniref:TetR/AcrR family transcriptional regulator n=1 Tax=Rhodopseudomonas sp. WA056 TaxID=2269367 RepID=UPI0013E039D0|nr:TetR/AcrR family transcriptional regulator [Rhodopseudomonas sp. WA056]NEW85854.1 TetR/AcrR family transcriptional regulator [Rhodopseudomonas sp. WA056]